MNPDRFHRASWRIGCLLVLWVAGGCSNQSAAVGWSGYAEGDYLYLSAAVPGTLQSVTVRQGDQVAVGATLFTLDDDSSRAALAEADARVVARPGAGRKHHQGQAQRRAGGDQGATGAGQGAGRARRDRTEAATGAGGARNSYRDRGLDDARTAAAQARDKVAELEASLRVAELPARRDEQAARRWLRPTRRGRYARRPSGARSRQPSPRRQPGWWPRPFIALDEFVRRRPAGDCAVAAQPRARRDFSSPRPNSAAWPSARPVAIRCDGCGDADQRRASASSRRRPNTRRR